MRKLCVILAAIFYTALLSFSQVQIPQADVPNLVVTPQIVVLTADPHIERPVLVYNTSLKSEVKWSLLHSKFIRIRHNLPNPIPNLTGGYLNVGVNSGALDDLIQVQKPDLLHSILSPLLGAKLPSDPIGIGFISVQEAVGKITHNHIIIVVVRK